jgi:hypothetical protein
MRCPHCNTDCGRPWEYCPHCRRNYGGAIYPDKQTAQEVAEIERIANVITDAFCDIQLEGGTTIHEADLEGCYSDDRVLLEARQRDPENQWQDIPDWKLERFHPHNFFDLKGWQFHVPAYMIWTLRHWRTSDSITIDWTIGTFFPTSGALHLLRYSMLSFQQASSVYDFLNFFCIYSNEPEPREAIEAYWHRFAPHQK